MKVKKDGDGNFWRKEGAMNIVMERGS